MGRRRVYSTRSANANRPKYRTPYRRGARGYSPWRWARRIMTQIHGIATSSHQGIQVPMPITAVTAQMAISVPVTTAQAPMATVPGENLTGLAAPSGSLGTSDWWRETRGPPHRLVRQPVQVDDRQVGQQVIELAQRLGVEGGVHPLVEFLGGQPPRGVVLAQQRCSSVAIRVRGADPRITRHRAPFFPDQPTPAYLPVFPANRPRPTSRSSRPTNPALLPA